MQRWKERQTDGQTGRQNGHTKYYNTLPTSSCKRVFSC